MATDEERRWDAEREKVRCPRCRRVIPWHLPMEEEYVLRWRHCYQCYDIEEVLTAYENPTKSKEIG